MDSLQENGIIISFEVSIYEEKIDHERQKAFAGSGSLMHCRKHYARIYCLCGGRAGRSRNRRTCRRKKRSRIRNGNSRRRGRKGQEG
ncbi:hypothetical protein [Pelosinus fermentans]|uniref:hypothetical protein n=1 Tax=Pelosinus fermentans TaxID=365349 RepID=UPI00130D5B71|nr:hypothetical protein [Pelosinus fermentans]